MSEDFSLCTRGKDWSCKRSASIWWRQNLLSHLQEIFESICRFPWRCLLGFHVQYSGSFHSLSPQKQSALRKRQTSQALLFICSPMILLFEKRGWLENEGNNILQWVQLNLLVSIQYHAEVMPAEAQRDMYLRQWISEFPAHTIYSVYRAAGNGDLPVAEMEIWGTVCVY